MAKPRAVRRLSKKSYEARAALLRENLVQLQVRLKEAPFKILLIVAGVEGAGSGDLLNTLGGWLDPRGVETFAFHDTTDEERERPLMWRYWRSLPPRRPDRPSMPAAWYTETLLRRARARATRDLAHLDRVAPASRAFRKPPRRRRHLDHQDLAPPLEERPGPTASASLEADDPNTAWRVSPEDWQHHRDYDRLARLARVHPASATHRPHAPWHDSRRRGRPRPQPRRRRACCVARFQHHLRKHGRIAKPKPRPPPPAAHPPVRSATPAASCRSTRIFPSPTTNRNATNGSGNSTAPSAPPRRARSIVFVFEGWDAAGKGGAIRRLTSAIDARDYRVIPIAKPTDEEKAHHYLWRFWRNIPRAGRVGDLRPLVVRPRPRRTPRRVSARDDEWHRAYTEINDFEAPAHRPRHHRHEVLAAHLRDEQLRRFRAREETAYKRHKINEEDWRNRRKWDAYEVAVGDMLALTDAPASPAPGT
ncbi:MAG: hypothetical protein QM760_05895 [Nibricoccus sp.]